MVDVSSRLRAARERAGLSIQDISARTKIKAVQLQAIECGEFERLPGPFFTRAFIKNFAREVGLAPDEIAREYDAGRRAMEQPPETQVTAELPRDAAPRTPAIATGQEREDERAPSGWSLPLPSASSVWPPLALALILLVVISVMSRQAGDAGEAAAVGTTGAVEAITTPAAAAGPVEKAPEVLTMEIAPDAVIWINAKADGVQAVYRLVQPGERLVIEARNDLTFRIGNAAAFLYTVNGVPGRALGASGEVVEFQITRENVHTYRR